MAPRPPGCQAPTSWASGTTRAVPRSAVRQYGTVAGRSCQHRYRPDAVEQLQHLRGGGPDDLAPLGGQPSLRQRVRSADGCARRPQPDQFQRQRWYHPEGALRGSRQRHGGRRLRHRAGEWRGTGIRPLCRFLLRRVQPSPHHGNLHRGHLSVTVAPWWQVQPDFQYVFNPGGGILNPNQPTQRIGNEAIFGLRNTITF